MSRSYYHSDIRPCVYDKSFKKIFNRRLRRIMKHKDDYEDLPQYGKYRKLNDSWDIVDMRIGTSWEEFKKWNWDDNPGKFFPTERAAKNHWKRYFRSK